jgi:hypothetical protein
MSDDKRKPEKRPTVYEIVQEALAQAIRERRQLQPGELSNAVIRQRNGGVKHMFEDDIGGCSANYR